MEQIIVTRRNGTTYPLAVKKEATAITQAQQSWGLLGDDLVNISIESPFPQQHEIGDWISVFGRIYTLNQLPRVRKSGVHKYAYDLTFEGVQYDLLRAFYDVTIETTGNTLQDVQGDALTGNLKRFATVLIANANRVFPDKWKLGTCPDTASDKTLTFGDGDNCLAVYQNLCKTFDVEANISVRDGVRTIDFVKRVGTTHPFVFEFGKGKGLYALDRQNVDSSNIVTRLKVFGSADNITNKYRANRLCLPGKSKAQSFIEEATAIQKYGIHEARKVFEDIKPTFNGRVSELVVGSVLKFKDASMFDLNALEADGRTTKYLVAGVSAKIHFNTGNLAGYEFDIHKYDHATRTFTLKKLTDDRGAVFPSATSVAFQFAVGDEYKILDVTLPEQYQTDAERRLQEQGREYYRQNSQPKVKYGLSVSKEYLLKLFADGTTSLFTPGDYINIKDESIGVDKAVRIQSLQRSLFDVYNYTLTIADVAESNITTRVISELLEIDKITTLHQLKDPTRAKANWRSSREVLDMVFDPDGDYYTDKIKPNSIDTLSLSVGAKSMQFALQNVVFDANYQGQKNVVKVSAGTLTHYTIEESARTWIVAPAVVSLEEDNTPYYILARCSKSGEAATMVFSKSPIRVEQEAGMYHFWIGVVNSVDETLQARSIALSYGFSTINGRFIKTGRIESADGNTYFDLDAGEIRGNILFKGGKTLDNAVSDIIKQPISEAKAYADGKTNDALEEVARINTAIRTLSIGGRNYIRNSSQEFKMKGLYKNFNLSDKLKEGSEVTISAYIVIHAQPKVNDDKARLKFVLTPATWITDNWGLADLPTGVSEGIVQKTITLTRDVTRLSVYPNYYYLKEDKGAEVTVKWIKLEYGNKATDYTEAPEDTADAIRRAETESKNLAVSEAGKAQANAIATAQADSTAKTAQALSDAKAYTDGKVNEAKASIQQVSNALNTAKSELQTAQRTATEAKTRAENTYTRAMADGKISEAERRAIAQAESKANDALAEASRRDTALKAELEGKVSSILSSVAIIQGDLQRQIDKQVEMFWGEQPPTGRIGWTEADDAKHEGDTYTVRSPEGVTITQQNAKQYPNVGKSWRWHGNGWIEIADTDVTRALSLAGEAKASADGKVTHFRGSAIPTGYKQGDLWTLTGVWNGFKQGSILTAIKDEVIGQYNPTHWKEEVRYTDDTALHNLAIGGRNYIRKKYHREQEGGVLAIELTETLPAGIYTFSCYAEIKRNKGYIGVLPSLESDYSKFINSPKSFIGIETGNGESGVYVGVIEIESPMSRIYVYPQRRWAKTADGGLIDFKWIKLEKGNKATDYTEAPEDVADALKKVDTDSTAKANQALNDAKAFANTKTQEANTYTNSKASEVKAYASQQASTALNDAKAFAREEDEKRARALRAEIMQDYLRRVIKDGSTLIKGGLLATNVIALKSTNGKVSSYIDGNEANNIAFATGVTDAFTANEKRAVEITHDGNARFGQMHLNGHDGVLSFAPIGSAESYLNIGGVPRGLDSLLGSTFNGDDRTGDTSFSLVSTQGQDLEQTKELIGSINIPKDGTAIKFSGKFHINVDQAVSDYDDTDYEYGRYGDDRDYWLNREREEEERARRSRENLKRTNAMATLVISLIKLGERGEEVKMQILNESRSYNDGRGHGTESFTASTTLEQGVYKVIARCTLLATGIDTSSTSAAVDIKTDLTQKNAEVHISNKAMYAVFGRENFLHVSEQGTTIKGRTDMPGVLAAGIARTTGTVQNAYGAKVNRQGYDIAVCERQRDNSYKVYHSIGHSNYSVQLTVFGDSRDAGCVMDIQDYYFTCCFYNPVDTYKEQHDFTYLCIGPNTK